MTDNCPNPTIPQLSDPDAGIGASGDKPAKPEDKLEPQHATAESDAPSMSKRALKRVTLVYHV